MMVPLQYPTDGAELALAVPWLAQFVQSSTRWCQCGGRAVSTLARCCGTSVKSENIGGQKTWGDCRSFAGPPVLRCELRANSKLLIRNQCSSSFTVRVDLV